MATSDAVQVDVYPTPDAPVTTDITIENPAEVGLSADVDNVLWYDDEDALFPFGAGPDFPVYVDGTTTFWAETEAVNPGTMATGGKNDRDIENGQFHQNNGFWLVFDAYQNFTIQNLKVYANGLGARTITLVNANGTTIQSSTENMQDGENVVDVNFFVPAGEGYGLRVSSDNPQLWRDGIGSEQNYPYPIGDVGAITGTSVNGGNAQNYYYFFYDWTVSVDAVGCPSERVPLTVTVTNPVGVGQIEGLNGVEAFPVPTNGALNLELDLGAVQKDLTMELRDATGRLILSEQWKGQATGRRSLDLGAVAPGHYTVRLTDGEGQWRLPVIRE